MTESCSTCRWFDDDFFLCADDQENPIGQCKWASDRLPFSLRYGARERVPVLPTDGVGCAGYEALPSKSESKA